MYLTLEIIDMIYTSVAYHDIFAITILNLKLICDGNNIIYIYKYIITRNHVLGCFDKAEDDYMSCTL